MFTGWTIESKPKLPVSRNLSPTATVKMHQPLHLHGALRFYDAPPTAPKPLTLKEVDRRGRCQARDLADVVSDHRRGQHAGLQPISWEEIRNHFDPTSTWWFWAIPPARTSS